MPKKILLAAEFLIIAYILFFIPQKMSHTGDEIYAFLPNDNIPLISETFETSEIVEIFETQTEETISEPTVREHAQTEIITTEKITEITTVEITTEAPTEPPVIPYNIAGIGYEGTALDEFKGPEEFAELHKLIVKYGKRVSVYYKDLTDGEEYFYNLNENYFIASLIKAPYVVYVYRCLLNMAEDEENNYDPEQTYKYIKPDYREGTGVIKNMEFGTEFTLDELIYYAICESDNVAMDKIRKIFPVSGFIDFAEEIGLPHIQDIRSAVNGRICARCAAAYIEAIYNFIEEGNIYSEVLKELMLSTRNKMIYADYPIVRKYGWTEDAFHDMGIVYNENRPYLIVILSNRSGAFGMFREISLAVQQYNENKPDIPEETEEPEEIETPEEITAKIEITTEPPKPTTVEKTTENSTEPEKITEKTTEIQETIETTILIEEIEITAETTSEKIETESAIEIETEEGG
ncbi:MAG: serine hydrolase [Oscillospiraceae bacterium]|nr:serine hydrolase [Oscillospiraceae bacterium]